VVLKASVIGDIQHQLLQRLRSAQRVPRRGLVAWATWAGHGAGVMAQRHRGSAIWRHKQHHRAANWRQQRRRRVEVNSASPSGWQWRQRWRHQAKSMVTARLEGFASASAWRKATRNISNSKLPEKQLRRRRCDMVWRRVAQKMKIGISGNGDVSALASKAKLINVNIKYAGIKARRRHQRRRCSSAASENNIASRRNRSMKIRRKIDKAYRGGARIASHQPKAAAGGTMLRRKLSA